VVITPAFFFKFSALRNWNLEAEGGSATFGGLRPNLSIVSIDD
jgi:hypothetical protein